MVWISRKSLHALLHSLKRKAKRLNRLRCRTRGWKRSLHMHSYLQKRKANLVKKLIRNTELDEIIARAQSFTRKENISKERNSVSSPEMNMIIARARSFMPEKKTSQVNQLQTRKIRTRLCRLRQRIIQATKATTKQSPLKEHQTRNMWHPMDK